MDKNFKFDTLQIHGGYDKNFGNATCAVPIYMTSAYNFKNTKQAKDLFSLEEEGNIYTRISNPTVDVLEKRIAQLEGGVGALCLSSGHSAIVTAILNIASYGDEIVSASTLYGGTYNLFTNTFKKFGIKVNLVNPDDPNNFEKATTEKTKAYFVETIGNPNANVADISKIASLAQKNNVPLIVDSTFTPPCLFKAFDFGANIIVHSATKYLCGHGNSIGGIIVDGGNFDWGNGKFNEFTQPDESYHGIRYHNDIGKSAFITKARVQLLRDLGSCISPFNSFLILQGIETLSLRMKKHCENAISVAKFLERSSAVSFVNYPGLESSKYYAIAQKYLPKGQGGIFTFGLKGTRETGAKFIDSLKLISNAANVGDSKSLIIHPATTTHSQLSNDDLIKAGISEATIRISVGIEDVEDIIFDLEQAIKLTLNN